MYELDNRRGPLATEGTLIADWGLLVTEAEGFPKVLSDPLDRVSPRATEGAL